jgi:hypothetical protein
MFAGGHRFLIVALTLGVWSAGRADAGWVSIRNETKQILLLQEPPSTPGGKPGRLIRLLPGECVREFHAKPGEKRIHVLDPKHLKEPLAQAKLVWLTEDLTVRIRAEKAVVRLVPPAGAKPETVVDLTKTAHVAKK